MHFEGDLVFMNMEQQLLVPDWVQSIPDDARAENLPAERDDHKGVHIPAGASHVLEPR